MWKWHLLPSSALLFILVTIPNHAVAQVGFVPHVGFNLAAEEFFFSSALQFKIPGAGIGEAGFIASPGFDYYPSHEGPSDVVDATGNTWVVNLDLLYPFQALDVAPYVGGGFYIARSTFRTVGLEASDTQVGLNLKGGLRFGRTGSILPFTEGTLMVGEGGGVLVRAGVYLRVGT